MTADPRARILVLNQYYWPGIEATAQLLAQLCEALARDYDVTVVTGQLRGQDLPAEETRNGVRILRARSTAYDRSQLHLRAANYGTYLADTALTALRDTPPDLVLCMTDPPIVGDVGLVVARRFDVPLLVISQDVFPEIAERVERLRQPIVLGALRSLVGLYLKRADRVVAIGETMKQRLEQKGAPAARIAVIPNWVDTAELTPRPRRNAWSQAHGLDDAFVVMHSGNVGHAQDLDALVRAATFLRDLGSLRIVVIGSGAREGDVTRLAQRLEVTGTVRFLGYQPRDVLPLSLASGDLHYIGLARGLSGYVVPSRVYGVLAAGRPVLVSADPDSETVRLVEEAECGLVVPPGRPELVAGLIRDVVEGRLSLEGMGERGRAWVEREADREVAFDRYRRLVSELVAPSPSPSSSR
ncbi:MAG: glycosyltransferase family 4 protein [Gaiella sp.]|nr:glycosyltransferase family 4 protein [Gaiella sp.]